MKCRWLSIQAFTAVGMATFSPLFSSAQAPSSTAVAGSVAASSWVPPRTAWGDPDISGIFTNKYEQSTPFERPDNFSGRTIEDVGPEELARLLAERQRVSIERAPFAGGDPGGGLGGPLHWGDRYEITKGSRPWFVVDPPDGKIPSLTDAARARPRARRGSSFGDGPFNSPADFSLYDRCISRGMPGSMVPAIYGNSYEILQSPDSVAIRYEMIHETRVVPLDGRTHVGASIRTYMGDARGRWEGNTLVVETTNFKPELTYRNANAETLRIVERFTRVSPEKIEWAVTVDDPTTWTKPWTFMVPLTTNESEPVFEYACHEGNYAIPNMLSAARAAEREAASSK